MAIEVAKTRYGTARGKILKDYSLFLGIPFAKPPVGALRLRPPEPPEPWEGERQPIRPNRAMQSDHGEGSFYYKEFYSDTSLTPPASEDCLYLNIWTPANSAEEKLPVMLWIHGGALIGGHGVELEFDGEALCKKGVILVSINYRLGAFGYLAHPELTKESGSSGNFGLLDQVQALKFVYENIKDFGGDPEKITIFGQSAGSMSVQALISSPLAKGMVAGAIMQSASGYKNGIMHAKSQAEVEEVGIQFLEKAGVKSIAELRDLDSDQLLNASSKFFMEYMMSGKGLPFAPCIDGYSLVADYDEALETGICHNVPCMIGSVENDLGRGPESEGNLPIYDGCVNWSLESEKVFGKPSYVYFFSRKPLGDDAGAFHSVELWYMFGTLAKSWRPKEPEDYDLSEEMVSYWANFAKTGNPNGEGLAEWKPCVEALPFVKTFDVKKC
ncbi:MAG: carboxylesterase family protein [Clostridiales bacterium]|jgi:para-nitrobenzyl esterase|nr:carboxylesterase family protein [Clostridiales bacterium]